MAAEVGLETVGIGLEFVLGLGLGLGFVLGPLESVLVPLGSDQVLPGSDLVLPGSDQVPPESVLAPLAVPGTAEGRPSLDLPGPALVSPHLSRQAAAGTVSDTPLNLGWGTFRVWSRQTSSAHCHSSTALWSTTGSSGWHIAHSKHWQNRIRREHLGTWSHPRRCSSPEDICRSSCR